MGADLEGNNGMKTVKVVCEHNRATSIDLQVPDDSICCIQCGLIQIFLDPAQAEEVRYYCRCMESKLYPHPDDSSRITMTIDPSQLDLGGEWMTPWIG